MKKNDKEKSNNKKRGIIVGIIFMLIGLALFVIKGCMPEYIDENGILHEVFFLIPIGYLFLFIGLIIVAIFIIKNIIHKHN